MVDVNALPASELERIAREGAKIYEEIRTQYDPKEKGRFLAIEVEGRNVYLGSTSADALASAREQHPNKFFYVVKIGFDAAETMAQSLYPKN